MTRLAWLLLVACRPPVAGSDAAPPALAPVLIAAPAEIHCPLRWDEFDAPARIPVRAWSRDASSPDACPADFAARAVELLRAGGCAGSTEVADPVSCARGTTRDGARAVIEAAGPGGSGRFWSVGLVVDAPVPRIACVTGSTVAWRHLHAVADRVGSIDWLRDVDRDGSSELVVWQRLAWGSSEAEHGLFPVVYTITDTELVRRDDLAAPVRARVAAAYRALPEDRSRCFAAVARALDPS